MSTQRKAASFRSIFLERAPQGRRPLIRSQSFQETVVFHPILVLIVFASIFVPTSAAQQKPSGDAVTAQSEVAVSVPLYANPSCPIMGKPVSTTLFADTAKGRIYVCCKGCIKDIHADVETAYRTAFPADKKIVNTICPVTGKEITKDSPAIVLQGFEFSVHDAAAARLAVEESPIVIAKLNDPKLVDLANKTCPVTGEAIVKNAFVVIDGQIVRLSSPRLVEEVQKDPAKVLAKAKELRGTTEK